MRNSTILTKIFLLLIFFSISSLISETYETLPHVGSDAISPKDPVFDKPLTRIVELSFSDRFEESLVILDSLIQKYPDHPAPYFFKAAVLQDWMSIFRFNRFQKQLEENIQKAIDIGNKLKEQSDDPWLNFYVGGAYGYRGFYRFRKYNWIGAYIDGKKGIENFQQALEKDSTLYDVYLGLGSYYYWRTAKSKFIKLIAFWMSDQRDLGLKQLEFALNHGRYAKYEAGYALLASLYDSKKYKQAFRILNDLVTMKDDTSLIDWYYRGRLLIQLDQWSEVEQIFHRILTRLENYPYQSIGFQVECKYWMAKALDNQGKFRAAVKLTQAALQQSRKRNSDREIEGYIEKFKDIQKDLVKLHYELLKKLETLSHSKRRS